MEEITTLARRTLYDVAFAAVVGASHLERARNRVWIAADRMLPPSKPKRPSCSLCGAPMVRAAGRSPNVDWWRCARTDESGKAHNYSGVPVEDAA